MRLVRRVRWLRVSLVGLLALVAFLSLRLWQWMAYAERQAASTEREEARAEASEQEVDRLNRELKDARSLVHGNPDEIVHFSHWGCCRTVNERLELIQQEYTEADDWKNITQSDVRALWTRTSRAKADQR